MFDCHIHSSFSGDSNLDAVSACELAIKAGLEGIAFTDHLDYDFPDFDDEFLIDFETYSRYMDNLKAKYKTRLKVLKGIEVGIQPHVIEDTYKVVKQYDFDYVLASVHIIDRVDPYKVLYYKDKTKMQAYSGYLEEVLFMVMNFDDFDAAGHLDYIIRCAKYDDRSLRYADHCDLLDSIFKVLASKGKGIEINTGSYRDKNDGVPVPEYDITILKRYRELGGEIVCLGSDSHSPEYIGYKFDYFSELLLEAGFKYTAHFEDRRPVFIPIKVRNA